MATNNLCSTDLFFTASCSGPGPWLMTSEKTNIVNMSQKKANGERDILLTVPEKLRTFDMKC